MIFSVYRPQYFISHTKSQRSFVTRHRLSCEKVNLHNILVTWVWDACGFLGLFIGSNTSSFACAAKSFQRIVRKVYPRQIRTHCGVSCVVCATVIECHIM